MGRLAVSVACALAAGCAVQGPAPQTSTVSATSAAASGGGESFTGRMNVDIPADDGEAGRNMTASFELTGDAATGQLDLNAPTGSTIARASWSPSEVRVAANGEDRRYRDVPTMTRAVLGEDVPLPALFDWLHGRPWPGATSTPDAARHGFSQLGWTVDLSRYDAALIVARRPAPRAVTVRVKLDRP